MSATASPSDRSPVPADLPAVPPNVRLTTLENGLVLILKEDHSAPVVSAQAWCQAGSIHEGAWLGAGLSHVLEHMLFKGTTTRGPARIDQEVQEAGGYMNAYTSFDRTVYYINVPNTGARVAIDILCDIMQHATLPAEELEKEKQVILREMDMNQDDPSRRASRRLFETAFTASPYRFTVIGYPDIFHEVQRTDLLAYYREKYAVNNLFFVVVGDVSADEVETQFRQAFATAKARPQPPMVLPAEPRQTARREVLEEAAIELSHFHFGWHIPELRHADVPILDVLATLLGAGRSSRLYQEVREKAGLVQSIDAWTYSPGALGLFGVSALAEAGQFAAARDAILVEVERMKHEPVTAGELTKAVKQFTAATLAVRKTMQGQAQDLGANWIAARDLNFSERYLAAVRSVTPADLQRVARTYLTAENRTLFALMPEGSAPRLSANADLAADHPVRKFELANGLRLLVKEDHRLPFVQFRAVFQGGLLAETPTTSGLTLLLAKMLLKGTATRNAEQIAREIESVGGSLDTYGGNNSFGINAEVLSGDFALGLELVADVIRRPSFPADALELERAMQLAALKAQRDQMLQSAVRLMRRSLFGPQGYGLDINGTEDSVTALQVSDLQTMHQRLAVPANGVLAIYGDVRTDEVEAAVRTAFAGWSRGEVFVPPTAAPFAPGGQRVSETRDKKQAVLMLGFPGLSVYDEDRYALELIQEACSDLGSRLFLSIREKLGLAYYVGAQNFPGLAPGYFGLYAGTAPEKLAQVEREFLREVALLRSEGLTAEELHRAQAKLLGQKKIARQDLGTLASTTALDELYGLGYAHADTEDARYQAVTLAHTTAIARKYLRPEAMVTACIQPETQGED